MRNDAHAVEPQQHGTARAVGVELSQTMGGSSGVLLAIFFAAAGDAASGGMTMQDALKAGLERMQEIGGSKLGQTARSNDPIL